MSAITCPDCGRADAVRVTAPNADPAKPHAGGFVAALYCAHGWGGCGRYRTSGRVTTRDGAIEAATLAFRASRHAPAEEVS